MITIEDIEKNIHLADRVCNRTDPSDLGMSDYIQYGILNALVAQAKVQLLSLQELAQDRAMRMEQIEIGKNILSMKSMKNMMGLFKSAPDTETMHGLQQYHVRLTTGEEVMAFAETASDAIRIVKAKLQELGLDPSTVSSSVSIKEQ